MKRQDYRTRVAKTLNFEEHIFSEFEELCKEENVYPSHKLQQLMIGELEKKVVGSQNPLNISYGKPKEKPSLQQQSDIRMWLPRHEAIVMARRLNLRADEYEHLSQTFEIIARKVKTGYLHRD